MLKKHANISFKGYNQGDLVIIATEIVNAMTANVAIFAKPTPSLESVTALITEYATILGKSKYAGKKGDLDNARTALEAALKKLGIYVNDIADGDLAILEKSGFPISKEPTPLGPLPAPNSLHVKPLLDGGFEFKSEIVNGYWGYIFAIAEVGFPNEDPMYWRTAWSPIPEHTITDNIIRGKEYKFAACAVASSKEIHWVKAANTILGL